MGKVQRVNFGGDGYPVEASFSVILPVQIVDAKTWIEAFVVPGSESEMKRVKNEKRTNEKGEEGKRGERARFSALSLVFFKYLSLVVSLEPCRYDME